MPNTRPKKPGTRSVGAFCAVYGCSNYMGKTRHLGISYHSFPRDPELRKIWIKKCRRADEWNPAKSYICSDHFYPDDFKRDLKAELMQCRKINQLIPGATPSRNLPLSRTTKASSVISERKRPGKMMDRTQNEGSGVEERMCIGYEYTMPEPQRSLFVEIHREPDQSTTSQVVYTFIGSESDVEDEEDSSLKTDIERLKYLVKAKDCEISVLERALNLSSGEKRKRGVSPSD